MNWWEKFENFLFAFSGGISPLNFFQNLINKFKVNSKGKYRKINLEFEDYPIRVKDNSRLILRCIILLFVQFNAEMQECITRLTTSRLMNIWGRKGECRYDRQGYSEQVGGLMKKQTLIVWKLIYKSFYSIISVIWNKMVFYSDIFPQVQQIGRTRIK